MSDDNAVLVDAFGRLLSDTMTPDGVRATERTLDPGPLWRDLHGSGFLDALVPEAAGGAGLTLAQVFPLILAIGEHAAAVPFAETMIARGLFAAGGGQVPDDAVVAMGAETSLVPFGALASHALIQAGESLVLAEAKGAGGDIFGTGSSLTLDCGEPLCSVPAQPGTLLLAAAAVTSAQMAGAMARVMEMTLRHAGERQQFGRPLGKFQAIQQQIAVLAEQVVSAQVAARTAFSGDAFDTVRVAAAKCRANEAANQVCAIAHAIHGAIGATAEFDLQLYTRRLKQWQLAYGSESFWGARLGLLRLAAGPGTTADFLRINLAHQEP